MNLQLHGQLWTLVRALLEAGADTKQKSSGGVFPSDLLSKRYVLATWDWLTQKYKNEVVERESDVPSDISAAFR